MLEHLRLRVDPVPWHAENISEEELDEAVMADDLEGDPLALGGQARAVVGLVLDDALVCQPLQHPGRRGGRDAEPAGDRLRPHGGLAPRLQLVERLGVVLRALVRAPLRVRVVCLAGHRVIDSRSELIS